MENYYLLSVLVLFLSLGGANAYERLDKDDAVLLVVDHQVGLFQLARDFRPTEFKQNILAHAALGKVFNLPTILTTSAENGDVIRMFCLSVLVYIDS